MKYLVLFVLMLLFDSAIIAQNMLADTARARILYNKGHYLQIKHKQQEAIGPFKEASVLFKKHKEYKKYFDAQNRITTAYRALSEHENAIRVATEMAEYCKKVYGEGHLSEGDAYLNTGISHSIQSNYDLAAKTYEKAALIFKKNDARRKLASVYNNLGIVHYYKGEFDVALKWYKKYEISLLEMDDASGLAALYNNTGALYAALGNNEEALEYISKSLELELQVKRAKRDWLALTKKYGNVSVLCRNNKQLDRAMDFIEKAEMTLGKLENKEHPYFADLYSARAAILADDKQTEEAFIYYKKELELLKKIKATPLKLSIAYSNLAAISQRLETFEIGFEYVNEAIRILTEKEGTNSYLLIRPYTNKSGLYIAQGDFENFIVFSKKALKIGQQTFGKKHPTNGDSYTYIASELVKLKRFEEAFEYLDKALEALVISEETDASKIIQNKEYLDINLFRIYLWTKAEASLKFYELNKDKKYLDQAYQILLSIQESIEANKNSTLQVNDKKKLLSRTQNMLSGLLQATYFYHEIGEKKESLQTSFSIVERNKSAILLEALRGASAQKFGDLPDSLQTKEENLKEEIATLEKNILDAQLEQNLKKAVELKNQLFTKKRNLEALYKLIGQQYPNYVTFKQGGDVDIKTLQDQILDEETALMEYYVTDSVCYQFVLSKTELHLFKLPVSKRQIDLKMLQFRRSISNYKYIFKNEKKAYKDYKTTAYWFYEQLVKPAESKLKGIKKLIVVPDYTLGHLPFGAFLTNQSTQKATYKTLDYLLNRYSIRYSYSAALLLENQKDQHEKKLSKPKLLAFAAAYNPIDTTNEELIVERTLIQQQLRRSLKALPATQLELEQLKKIFPQGDFYAGEEATEAQFKASLAESNILHLAMHGILNNNHPIASSLVFTENGDSLEDNFLHAYEISQMALPMDLVVLSACETGYGKFEQGEGVMSMARSFMYAGVPSLLVSLWQVNDASTAIIMEGFYHNLSKGMDKDVALTETKKEYLKYAEGMAAHPAYWAPFIQLGDAQAIMKPNNSQNWMWGALALICCILGGLFWAKRKK